MNVMIEKNYTVQSSWVFKNLLNTVGYSFFLLVGIGLLAKIWPFLIYLYAFYSIYFIFLVVPFTLIPNYSTIKNWNIFHVKIKENGVALEVNNGQQNFPFEKIRNIYFFQDRFDRLFSLGSVTFEVMDKDAVREINYNGKIYVGLGNARISLRRQNYEIVGKRGNLVHIPGLSVKDALEFKREITDRMKASQQ